MSLVETVKKLLSHQVCVFTLPGLDKLPIMLFEDNGAVNLLDNPICTKTTKHIDLGIFFVREKLEMIQ